MKVFELSDVNDANPVLYAINRHAGLSILKEVSRRLQLPYGEILQGLKEGKTVVSSLGFLRLTEIKTEWKGEK
jgi:hypothetical protein